MKLMKIVAATLLALSMAQAAAAATFKYTFENANLGDVTFTGSFGFNETSQTFFDVNVTLAGGTGTAATFMGSYNTASLLSSSVIIFSNAPTTVGNPGAGIALSVPLLGLGGADVTNLYLGYGPLFNNTSAGITINTLAGTEGYDTDSALRGSSASVVPLPAGAVLLLSGLIGFGALRARRT